MFPQLGRHRIQFHKFRPLRYNRQSLSQQNSSLEYCKYIPYSTKTNFPWIRWLLGDDDSRSLVGLGIYS